MGYIRKWWDTPNGRVVEEYHSRGQPPPENRGKKRKATPEEMKKANRRQKERNIKLLIMNNFGENDYYVTLTYRKEERPGSMEECKKQFQKFIRRVKEAYKKAGGVLKWIRNIEIGTRGGMHIHLIMNRIRDGDVILRRCWPYGGVHTSLLYAEGGFRKLAAYMAKEGRGEDGILESSYSTSRNLDRPEPHKKAMTGKTFREKKIRVPQGYYLDKDSLYEGINAYTGYPYRYYTLLILTDRRRE